MTSRWHLVMIGLPRSMISLVLLGRLGMAAPKMAKRTAAHARPIQSPFHIDSETSLTE